MTHEQPLYQETFDPRRHSAVTVTYGDRQPYYTGHSRAEDVPLKNFRIGPNVPVDGGRSLTSLRRPHTSPATTSAQSSGLAGTTRPPAPGATTNSTAPDSPYYAPSAKAGTAAGTRLRSSSAVPARKLPNGEYDPHPRVLNKLNAKWLQEEMPMLVAESQAQPLQTTPTLTATLPGSAEQRAVRPVTAIYSYNDVSPVTQADAVVDTDTEVTLIKDSTVAGPRIPVSRTLAASREAAAAPQVATALHRTGMASQLLRSSTACPEPSSRTQSIDNFWARQAGVSFNLAIKDLDRADELARNVPPGTPNCRLVGSRWRHIQRPVEGDVVYTDYYGPFANQLANYYGRAYTMGPAQFHKNRVVGDNDYVREQASMPGIYTLRNRPGLVMQSTIVNGSTERLHSLHASEVPWAKGVHKLHEFSRLQPAAERALRPVWNDRP